MIALLLLDVTLAGPLDLPDPHDELHARATWWQPGTFVVAGAQRHSTQAIEAWRNALDGTVVVLVDFGALPFFVPRWPIKRQLVRAFPEGTVVLCDWSGEGYTSLGFTPGALVEVGRIGSDGGFEVVARGEPTPEVTPPIR